MFLLHCKWVLIVHFSLMKPLRSGYIDDNLCSNNDLLNLPKVVHADIINVQQVAPHTGPRNRTEWDAASTNTRGMEVREAI